MVDFTGFEEEISILETIDCRSNPFSHSKLEFPFEMDHLYPLNKQTPCNKNRGTLIFKLSIFIRYTEDGDCLYVFFSKFVFKGKPECTKSPHGTTCEQKNQTVELYATRI